MVARHGAEGKGMDDGAAPDVMIRWHTMVASKTTDALDGLLDDDAKTHSGVWKSNSGYDHVAALLSVQDIKTQGGTVVRTITVADQFHGLTKIERKSYHSNGGPTPIHNADNYRIILVPPQAH